MRRACSRPNQPADSANARSGIPAKTSTNQQNSTADDYHKSRTLCVDRFPEYIPLR
jgi:hypothetical protein